MNCYIIDDEQYAIDTLSRYIDMTSQTELVGSSTSASAGLEEIRRLQSLDLVFLDVDMPGMNGIEVAQLLPREVPIVFISAHSRFAVEAYNLEIIDFLLKPIPLARFLKTIEKVGNLRNQSIAAEPKSYLYINPGTKGKVLKVQYSEILYIEGLKNYIVIHTINQKKIITYLTMTEIQHSIPVKLFDRIHKSFIINKQFVDSVEGSQVKLKMDVSLPIGVMYKDVFTEDISKHLVKSKRV